jgi:hypothetical protein
MGGVVGAAAATTQVFIPAECRPPARHGDGGGDKQWQAPPGCHRAHVHVVHIASLLGMERSSYVLSPYLEVVYDSDTVSKTQP